MLRKRYNAKKKRSEWALVSKKTPSKVLKWFGARKPSKAAVDKEERRVRRFS